MGATRPASTFGGYGRFDLVIIGYQKILQSNVALSLRALVDTGGARRLVSDISVETFSTRFLFRCLRCVGDQAMNWNERLRSYPRVAIR